MSTNISLAMEWQSFATMVFPGASADQLKHLETAFYSGARALSFLQQATTSAVAGGQLGAGAALEAVSALDEEIEDFGRRRVAELNDAQRDETMPVESPPANDVCLTNEQKIEAFEPYQQAIQEAIAPLIVRPGCPGMAAVRVFYTLRQKDGTMSSSHSGYTADPRDGAQLKRAIPQMLKDKADHAERYMMTAPKRN